MFSSIVKYIITIVVIPFILIIPVFIFIRLIVLNEAFYTYSFRNHNSYKYFAEGARGAANDFLIGQFSTLKEYEQLSPEDKEKMVSETEKITAFINEANVQKVVDGNLKNMLRFANGKVNNLIFYLPLNELDIPETVSSQIPVELSGKSEFDAVEMLVASNQNTPENLATLSSIGQTSKLINMGLFTLIFIQLFLYIIYFAVSPKNQRINAVGKILTFAGVIVLIFSWTVNAVSQSVLESVEWGTKWIGIILDPTLPIFIKPLIMIYVFYGLLMLLSGIILFNKNPKNHLVTTPKVK